MSATSQELWNWIEKKADRADCPQPFGTVIFTQSAAVAISAGIRKVTGSALGVIAGLHYALFPVSYSLNGGATVAGLPAGYALHNAWSETDNQLIVSLTAPLLSIGQSYAISCDVMRNLMFGLLDWIKMGAAGALAGLATGAVVWPLAHANGVSDGRDAEQAAARTRALQLIAKRSEDNEEISEQDVAGLCAELGGRWVSNENRCD